MKYWWLKKYKGLKIKSIPELQRDVNSYFVMPKNYKDRYTAIKLSEIETLEEEDLKIYLYTLLNHEKIKNNRIIKIIDRLLEIPDNFLPATNYTLEEMLEEVKHLKSNPPLEEKLSTNNVAACPNCLEVFYVDKIKYVNKKGYCLCPFCKSSNLLFDNDLCPMDDNFLRLARFVLGTTTLGCKFKHIQKLVKKSIKLVNDINLPVVDSALFIKGDKSDINLHKNYVEFTMEEISYKKGLTTKEEQVVNYKFQELFQLVEKNLISNVIIDTSIIKDSSYILNISLLLEILNQLGKNPYLKKVILLAKDDKDYKLYHQLINTIIHY